MRFIGGRGVIIEDFFSFYLGVCRKGGNFEGRLLIEICVLEKLDIGFKNGEIRYR